MTNAVFEFSVTVFERHLKLLSKLLETAETYAKNREVEPTLLVFSRLYPDMFTLAEQVRAACNTAKRSTAMPMVPTAIITPRSSPTPRRVACRPGA